MACPRGSRPCRIHLASQCPSFFETGLQVHDTSRVTVAMIWATTVCSKAHGCGFKKERDTDATPFCVGGQGLDSQSEIFRTDSWLPWCLSFAFTISAASWPISVRYNGLRLFALMEGGPPSVPCEWR